MKTRVVTTVFALLMAAFMYGSALAEKGGAFNDMSWLDGFSLVVLDGEDVAGLHRARTAIQTHGGRVAIMSPPSLILGWIPYEIRDQLIGKAGIKHILYTEVLPGETGLDDRQSRVMLNYFNSIVRGDYQKKYFEEASRSAAVTDWPKIGSDALQPPPLDEVSYIKNLEAAGLDIKQLREHGILRNSQATAGNSDAMTGTISVTLFFVESNGSIDPDLYTWTDQRVQEWVDGVNTGLAWWTAQAYNYFDCWNAFLVRYFPPTDVRCQQGYEPVEHTSGFSSTWVSLVMANFGYTSGGALSRVDAFNTWQRTTYGTDWAYSAFIGYNPPGAPDRFTNGTSAFAYLGGPYTVLLYRSYSWSPDRVYAHESGHIFYACDEYDGSNCDCANCVGRPNQNCYLCSSNPCMMKSNSFTLCAWTPQQVGWAGTSCAPPPLPAPATSGVAPPNGLQGVPTTITVSGNDFVYGASVGLGPDVTVHSTTFVNATTLTADITINSHAPLGMVDVTVTNRDLQSSTLSSAFEIMPTRYHYASPTGNNVFPYVSPADAATSFADVLNAAGTGDSVLVETGTYNESDSLSLLWGITLLGAWNGTFDNRNLVSGKSVIDLTSTASHSVLIQSGGDATTIDGFIIQNGEGSLQPSPIAGDYGGAVYIKNSTVTIANCEIGPNVAGQSGNYGAGGGVYGSGSTIDMHDNLFSQNQAAQGGAVCLDNCSGSLVNNTFSSNHGVFSTEPTLGGAIYLVNSSSITLIDNTITGNSIALVAVGCASSLRPGSLSPVARSRTTWRVATVGESTSRAPT
jgi:hypothetical protein